jgi:peptidoglycan/xylan/chitin deacetylase (PgdA/CDA1 family)
MIRQMIKRIVSPALSAKLLLPADRRVILIFHDVSDPGGVYFRQNYSTRTATFRRLVEFLDRHFELVSLRAITEPGEQNRRRPMAAITFDDGFRSVRTEVLPFLDSKGIPFAAFVCQMAIETDSLLNGPQHQLTQGGRERVFLDRDDVLALLKAGVTIGSHSTSHRNLARCSAIELEHEIAENKQYLETLIGLPIPDFAFPYGKSKHYNSAVIHTCFAVGHERAYSSNHLVFRSRDVEVQGTIVPRIALTNESPRQLTFMINRAHLRGLSSDFGLLRDARQGADRRRT